jgi:hypothetical protein
MSTANASVDRDQSKTEYDEHEDQYAHVEEDLVVAELPHIDEGIGIEPRRRAMDQRIGGIDERICEPDKG